jgi:magnesium and cobalt transporter
MYCLKATTPFIQAVDALVTSGHSRIPVYRRNKDDIIGLLYAKDLLGQLQRRDAKTLVNIESLVRKPPSFIPETQKIHNLLTEMRQTRHHMSIVVDEFGGTAGLITIEDIIEELVGEIRDEFDAAEPTAREVSPDTWIVNALLSLNDLEDITGIELPNTGEYESVGGFVIAEHGAIPAKGDEIESTGVRIKVLACDARHVEKVEIKLNPKSETPSKDE